jgi:hypothetical protein
MAVAHYRYLVLKMSSSNGVLKIRGDRDAGACVLDKLQALSVAREAAEEPGARTLCHRGGAALNLFSLAVFKKLHIPMGKLQPLRPFSGVGPVSVMSRGCISLLITLGTAESFRMESVLFDVVEVKLPFNAILGKPALYQFMVVAHYGYLVLKMPRGP